MKLMSSCNNSGGHSWSACSKGSFGNAWEASAIMRTGRLQRRQEPERECKNAKQNTHTARTKHAQKPPNNAKHAQHTNTRHTKRTQKANKKRNQTHKQRTKDAQKAHPKATAALGNIVLGFRV